MTKADKTEKRQDGRVNFRTVPAIKRKMEAEAESHRLPLAEFVRMLFDFYLTASPDEQNLIMTPKDRGRPIVVIRNEAEPSPLPPESSPAPRRPAADHAEGRN